jgi:alkanesulfonate monooxygenase SsuD/methylene tetrahydromethanopterin reductase-like flavin-dependent oxidoreductase (luciferase family)
MERARRGRPGDPPHSLVTYVTCLVRRYHPAVVAQKVATMQLLSGGRFTLGLGAGENLNEHMAGGQWPHIAAPGR